MKNDISYILFYLKSLGSKIWDPLLIKIYCILRFYWFISSQDTPEKEK